MRTEINRRQALATMSTVSLGALLAAACGGEGDGERVTAAVETTGGGTVTVQPQTTGSATAELFDEAARCSLTPEMTEGPYYFDVDAIRSDIREDRQGTPLRLAVRVRDAAPCSPIANAVVDIWHCDALGVYSGFETAPLGGGGGAGRTDDETYLRGAQVTNSDGIVEFLTVYPGWYRGRTVHIHAKVHLDRTTVLTTQFYFDEEVTAAVYEREPYASDAGRDTFNDTDGIVDERTVLTLREDGEGYLGVIALDVDS
jgi:protocatechuate 3,4-dioxygenase beta subunit